MKKFLISFLVTVIMLAGLSALVLYLSFSGVSIGELISPDEPLTGRTNILVMGLDVLGQNSDSMILVSMDHQNNSVDLMSIPRDTRVKINGEYCKINAAHAIGGDKKAVEVVEKLLGTQIPYYLSFKPEVFRDVIDAVGGIYYEVPERMQYNDPYQDLYIDLYPGYQLLDGDHAEQLVRFRGYVFGDMDRTAVQRDFIKAVVEQKLNLSMISKVGELYEVFSEQVSTNLSMTQLIKLAASVKNLNMSRFRTHVLPCELLDVDGISYVKVRQKLLDQMMVDYFGETVPGVVRSPESELGSTVGNGLVTEPDDEDDDDGIEGGSGYEYEYVPEDTVGSDDGTDGYYVEEYYEDAEDGTEEYYVEYYE